MARSPQEGARRDILTHAGLRLVAGRSWARGLAVVEVAVLTALVLNAFVLYASTVSWHESIAEGAARAGASR